MSQSAIYWMQSSHPCHCEGWPSFFYFAGGQVSSGPDVYSQITYRPIEMLVLVDPVPAGLDRGSKNQTDKSRILDRVPDPLRRFTDIRPGSGSFLFFCTVMQSNYYYEVLCVHIFPRWSLMSEIIDFSLRC
jgi:hypothetical protein